jgi:invasion protein IalB
MRLIPNPSPRGLIRGLSHRLAVVLMAMLGGLALTGAAAAQVQVKGKFGDWEMRCETPPGASREQCAIIQSVAADDKPNMNLVVIVLKTADGKSRLLRVIAPLGVLLPAGLGLNIDGSDKGRAGFVRCLPSGCVAEVVMDDKLLADLRTGKSATFIVFETPEQGTGIPLALAGFSDGFDRLP